MKLRTIETRDEANICLQFIAETSEETRFLNDLAKKCRLPNIGEDSAGNVVDICFTVPKK